MVKLPSLQNELSEVDKIKLHCKYVCNIGTFSSLNASYVEVLVPENTGYVYTAGGDLLQVFYKKGSKNTLLEGYDNFSPMPILAMKPSKVMVITADLAALQIGNLQSKIYAELASYLDKIYLAMRNNFPTSNYVPRFYLSPIHSEENKTKYTTTHSMLIAGHCELKL